MTPLQAWVAAVVSSAYTGLAVVLVLRPAVIRNEWSDVAKRIVAGAMVVVGLLFIFLSVYNAVTRHCLGTDLNSP